MLEDPAPEEPEGPDDQESLLDDIIADSGLVDDMLDEAEKALTSDDGDDEDEDFDPTDEEEEEDDEDFGEKFSFE